MVIWLNSVSLITSLCGSSVSFLSFLSSAFQVAPSFDPSIFGFCLEAFTIAFHSLPAQVSAAAVKGYELESSQTLKLTRRNTHDTHAGAHTPPHTSTHAVLLHYPLHIVLSLVYLRRQTTVATNFVLLSHAYANIRTNISWIIMTCSVPAMLSALTQRSDSGHPCVLACSSCACVCVCGGMCVCVFLSTLHFEDQH